MTQAIEHSAHPTALIANSFDLDSRGFETKTKYARLFPQRAIQNGIVDLGHPPANTTDQELAAVLIFGAITSQERIQCIETMYETGFLQELQGSVDRGWSGFLAILGQFRQDLVGADRLVLAPHNLKDAPSQRSQVDPLRCAYLFGRRDRALNASRMVMRRSLSVYHTRPVTLFCGLCRLARWTSPRRVRHSIG
jgi:hypothetical protein